MTDRENDVNIKPRITEKVDLYTKFLTDQNQNHWKCTIEQYSNENFKPCCRLCKFLSPNEQKNIIMNKCNMLNQNVSF